jgi:hypothetical protein
MPVDLDPPSKFKLGRLHGDVFARELYKYLKWLEDLANVPGPVGPQGPQGPVGYPITAVYGAFSDSTDQAFVVGSELIAKYNTTEASYGVTVANDPITLRPTRLTVPQTGVYSCCISPQFYHTGGGTETITFWARVNGTDVPRSASSVEMGNNNNRNLPFCELILPLTAGQYVEWVFTASSGTTLNLEAFPAVTGPPAVPAIPSVIASVKLIGG